jgi:inhibitor of KinA
MSTYHPFTIFPLGDAALTVEFSNTIDRENNNKTLQLFQQLKEARMPHIKALVPAYSSLTIHYDVTALHTEDRTAFETMAVMIERFTEGKEPPPGSTEERLVRIPVCYEKKYAPDMEEVAAVKNISPEEISRIHSAAEYRVYMLGFVPGFAYMAEVDERIAIARKEKPRLQVPVGSVGITGRQTGVYPLPTPGGWQIIGRTPMQLFNKEEEQPVFLRAGDRIQFYSITADEFENYKSGNT